jgi:hypothetical protein
MKEPLNLDIWPLMIIIVNQLIGSSKGIRKWHYY